MVAILFRPFKKEDRFILCKNKKGGLVCPPQRVEKVVNLEKYVSLHAGQIVDKGI